MAWNEAVVTNKGLELLAAGLSGGGIVITEAAGGEEGSPLVSLMGLTGVAEPCHSLKIAKISMEEGKLTVNVRAQNVGLEQGYVLKQIGLFARLDAGDKEEDNVLFAVIQDSLGEEIPSQKENPEFLLEFDFVIPISNAEKINAVVSPETFATLEELGEACEGFEDEVSRIDGELGGLKEAAEESGRALYEHRSDGVRHITAEERSNWNGKAAGNHTHSAATQSAAGLMSADDKKKLDGVAASANNYAHPTTSGSKHIPSGGSSGQILRWSADGTAAWGADNNTTYSNMGAASASAAGKAGLVPAPAAGAQTKFLRGDGTWQTPPDTNTTYSAATQSAAGLMSADDKKKLDGVAASANNYAHPTTSGSKHIPSGGSSGQILRWSADGTAAWGADNNTTYVNMTAATASAAGKAGLVPAPAAGAQTKFLRGDGTWQTPPDTNTTYSAATATAAGLMSAADKTKLDGIATGANAYSHPTTTGNKHIPSGGSSGQILRWSADGTAAWGADNNTTYSNMTAASASAAGKAGLVPAPAAGAQTKYLRGDGTWQTPPDTNTTYSAATQSAAGLMSADDKKRLDGLASGLTSGIQVTYGKFTFTNTTANSISNTITIPHMVNLFLIWETETSQSTYYYSQTHNYPRMLALTSTPTEAVCGTGILGSGVDHHATVSYSTDSSSAKIVVTSPYSAKYGYAAIKLY